MRRRARARFGASWALNLTAPMLSAQRVGLFSLAAPQPRQLCADFAAGFARDAYAVERREILVSPAGRDFTLLRMVRNGSPRASWKTRRESGAFRIIPSPRLRQSRQPQVGRGRGVTCVACCASGEGRRRCGAGRGVPLLVAAAANRKLRHQLTARPETSTLTVTTTMRNLTTTAIRIAISMMIITRAGGVRAELP
jgi:hypothetical protein